ncbi:MAG TPA: AbrB/MazE/SpoVT family DNA-binding domain-containing protein [Candidatus Hydrogenedentes bacterium]|nr:AbrB/MazE/SpoVT family DNA-binding domain-containing protein [Candidatus Hydrogenedentota bacterium]
MATIKVSPKFQIVIPKDIRQQANIQPGQTMEIFHVGGIIELVPIRDMKSLRGSLPGLDTEVVRD